MWWQISRIEGQDGSAASCWFWNELCVLVRWSPFGYFFEMNELKHAVGRAAAAFGFGEDCLPFLACCLGLRRAGMSNMTARLSRE